MCFAQRNHFGPNPRAAVIHYMVKKRHGGKFWLANTG
jgi:hypothetical protein